MSEEGRGPDGLSHGFFSTQMQGAASLIRQKAKFQNQAFSLTSSCLFYALDR